MVTVSTSPSKYHHGDLRAALVEAGIAALEGPAGEAPSLRALAREAGVSPTAVYRHFPDKQALLGALAQEGLMKLGAAQQAAMDRAGGGVAGFAETGREYVRFALAHPALFRLVFSQGDSDRFSSEQADPARDLLYASTRQLTRNTGEAERLALQAWAIAHGVAMLMLDGRMNATEELICRLINAETLFPLELRQGSSSEESP
jgi:AcrR family transcriptional regulator